MGFVLILAISCKKDKNYPPAYKLTDIDGNVYDSVIIGTQVWMLQNLKVTKFNDGTPIPSTTDNDIWGNLLMPAYNWYNNDAPTYKNTYGALYNWYTIGIGNLCPTGWHVPSYDELNTLINFLGGKALAGGKLKETSTAHWSNPNTGANNESGFTSLPGGYRHETGPYGWIGTNGFWWSANENDATDAIMLYMEYDYGDAYLHYSSKKYGYSVRCLRN